MPKRMAHATKPRPPITRMTRNNQLTLAKSLTESRGIGEGTLFQVEAVPEGFLFRPLSVEPGKLAAERARAGIGLSRAFDNADELLEDLHRVTKNRRAVASRRRKR